MVKPTQPKGIKPKAEAKEGGGGGGGGAVAAPSSGNLIQAIIVNTFISVIVSSIFVTSNYFLTKGMLDQAMTKISQNAAGGGEEAASDEGGGEEGEAVEKGIILDLGEFILNLSDPKARRYLKVNVAIELSRTPNDPDPAKGCGGEGGHGGGVDPVNQIENEMSQYKPSIRDAIISTMSSKTAEELSSVAGKELAKEQIKEAVNAIFAGEREVLRVSFGNFIIQ